MKKYKYTVNGKVSYMNVSDDRLEEFLKLYPDATVVGNEVDFQIDPANAETSAGSETNTVSNSDNGLLESREIARDNTAVARNKFIDPIKIIQDRESKEVYENYRGEIKTQADELYKANASEMPVTDWGSLDFDKPEEIQNFRSKTTTEFVQKNPIIQNKIVPRVVKSIEPQLDLYIANAKEKYDLIDPNNITQENIDLFNKDVQSYYGDLMNTALSSDFQFKNVMTDFNEDFQSRLGSDHTKYIKDVHTPEWMKYLELGGKKIDDALPDVMGLGQIENVSKIPKIFYNWGRSFNTSAQKTALGLTAREQAERDKSLQRNKNLANKYNWSDETVGYVVDDPSNVAQSMRFRPKQMSSIGYEDDGIIANWNQGKEMTWKEFQELYANRKDERVDQMNTRAVKLLEDDIIAAAYDEGAFDKLSQGIEVSKNVGALVTEQLPNMLGAVLTMGALPAIQIGGDVYWDQIQNKAREVRQANAKAQGLVLTEEELYSPVSPEEMISVLEDDNFADSAAMRSVSGGFIGGQLERIGAAKVFKPFAIKGVASILRGGSKKIIKNALATGGNMSKGGFSEALTEIGQDLVQSVASGNELNTENMFEAGATGFIVGAVLPGVAAVKSQSVAEFKTVANVIAGKLNPKSTEAYFNGQLKQLDNLIVNETDPAVQEDLQNKRDALLEVRNANTKIPGDFNNESKKQSLDLLIEKNQLEKQTKDKDKSLVTEQLNRIAEIDLQLKNISDTDALTKKVLKANKKGDLGITIIEAKDASDAKKEAENNKMNLGEDANSTGYTSQDGKTIIIDMSKAAELGEVNTAAHEMLHAILFKTLYTINDSGNVEGKNVVRGLAQALQTELNSLDPDIIKTPELAERIRLYQKEPSSIRAEEVLTLFADALYYGDIQYNDGVFTKLKDILRRLLQNAGLKNIEFNSGKDVYNFLKDYNKGVSRGNLGKAINKASKEGAVVGKKIKRFTGPEAVQRAKQNKSTAALAKTKDKFKSLEDNFQSGSAQNTIASELFNMVDTQIGNRFNLRPQVKQDLRDDVIERIYKAQETTKWDGRGDLYGFINGRIAKRILDAVRSDSTYLENVDSNQFEQLEKAANEITESSTISQKSKPQYRNLLKSNILSSDVIYNVSSKVLRTVRTLKSKLDEKISKNRTITPLIAEIKKDLGKQADIDLKKAMGGIKDNAIQKFLTKNKKAILENMTTTWLMGAIPSAVQKQVDGKFISNWQGQKIDRETVNTDSAGRTSGAEITRRKPNVASMPDAEFLSYFITDNKLIRGRKESLAKAMAEEISLEIFNTELQNENSDISKAFEQNQSLKGTILLDNYIAEVAKQTERGNVKFSKSLNRAQAKIINSKKDALINKILDANINLTKKRLLPMLQDTYPELPLKVLEEFASESINSINRFVKKIDITKNLDFIKFLTEADILKSQDFSLMKVFGLEGSATELFENADNISNQRGMEYAFNSELVAKEGADGLIKILKWGRGHQVTSGKIGGGRDQAYAGNPDYIDNNLNNIPDVEIVYKKGKSTSIKAVFYQGIEVKNWKERIKTPSQSADGGIQKFRDESDYREEQAREAWNYLNEFLSYVNTNGNMLDWAMAMQSLKSNMSAVLKAAAPVKYHFKGDYKGRLRYEHVIPTKEMIVRLTNYYKNGKTFDLDTLRDKYNVAIVPVVMDNNFNVLTQSQMNSSFDLMNDPEYKRYFNENTFGYPNMFPIETLSGENKGDIQGEAWVEFNNVLKPYAAKNSRSANRADKAMNAARLPDYAINPKGISVYDFDDTLAFSKSKIIVTMPNGEVVKITPAEFAAKDETLSEQGATFDFSEFNKVVKGTKGPLAARLEKAIKKFGNKNIYVLTARPQASAPAIYEFLKGIGLEIPMQNITGLQDGRPSAKADWMIDKFAEGYNDFYFVDDAYKNVKAVQDVLSALDVKSKVQQARVKFNKSLNRNFNDMIERNKGIKSEAQFSDAVARKRGANKGKYRWFIPSSADDFRGLTQYTFAGKGKQGEADQAFFEKALMDPYFAGVSAIESSRQMMKNAYSNLLKQMKPVRKKLNKLIPDTSYTYDQAIRVYLWNKAGYDIPGLSKRDLKKLVSVVSNDSDLSAFADGALLSSKQEQWSEPSEHWQVGTILRDLNELTEKVNRKEYLGEFIANSEILFSPENMNKIEAIYGSRHREALEDALYRMRNGTNRPSGGNRLTNAWNNWVNNSVGTIMFFNRRSALLQLLSTVNFINWSDNNPLKAGIAFANQPQYWKDWVRIFNSDKLKQRRGGLKSDIQEQEIASQAKNSKDKSSAIIAYLLKIGFTPTQIADSMAIATGGATFYRNRINTYLKQDMSKEEAEAKAWEDFSKISDEAQQSGDPALISQQQASVLGRLVLAFQNTPMQYTRLMKKAGLDIINKRGDFKTNFSKIIYYGAVQNFIFSALQNALFAMIPGFDDEEETEEDKKKKENQKTGRIVHSMVDTILRGSGLAGAVATTTKNTIRKFLEQEEKGFTADHTYTIIEAANISPPIGSKLRKLYGAIQTWKFDKDVVKERGFDVTLDGKLNISPTYNIIGNLSSALINLPLDRALMEIEGITEAFDERNTLYQRIALALGWRTWGVGAKNEEEDLIKVEAKAKRKIEGKKKAKETREKNKAEEKRLIKVLEYSQYRKFKKDTKGMSISKRIDYLKKIK